MHRIIFEWGPFVLYSYGLSLVVGFLAATWLMRREALRDPSSAVLTGEQWVDFACLAMLSGILGGRVFFVALYWPVFRQHPWEIPAIWHGGLIWYGGLAAGVFAGWVYGRRHQASFLRGADFIAPYLALAQGIGRIGCFLNGCCYGHPTTSWLGVRFPALPGPVLPTQLFEAAGLFLLFILLRTSRRRCQAVPGRLMGAYLAGYAVLRFVIEFLRQQRIVWAGLTLQQLLCVAVFAAGVWLCLRRARPAA